MSLLWRFLLPVFGLMGARLAGAAFGFLSQLLLARSFSAHDVGIAFLAMSTTVFASLVITGGYHSLGLVYLARYQSLGRSSLVRAFLAASRRDMLLIGLAVLVLSFLAYWFAPFPADVRLAVLFGCLAALPLALIRLNNSVANALRRFTLSYAPDFVFRPGLLLALLTLVVLMGIRLPIDMLLVAMALIAAAVCLGQSLLLGKESALSGMFGKSTPDLRPFYRNRAIALLLIAIVAGASADLIVMIGSIFLTPAEVAVLGVAVRLAALVGFFGAASQQFVLRDLTSAMKQGQHGEVDSLLFRTNAVSLVIMALSMLAVFLFGPFLLGLFGPEYQAGYWVLQLFMLSQALRTISGMNGHLLALGGHQIRSAKLCLAALAVLVVASALLVPIWGLLGIGVAALLSEAFWAIGLAALTQRLEGRRGDIFGLVTI